MGGGARRPGIRLRPLLDRSWHAAVQGTVGRHRPPVDDGVRAAGRCDAAESGDDEFENAAGDQGVEAVARRHQHRARTACDVASGVILPAHSSDMGSFYDSVCARCYALCSRVLLPDLRNSQYVYRDALRRLLGSGAGTWLDLGCGHDFLPPWFEAAERHLDTTGWTVVGLDPDLSALRRHGGLRHKVRASAERIPLADGSISLISANMMVEHVEHPAALFEELGRVLAPGGR